VSDINLSRVYDREPAGDGKVFLVDWLWHRGVRKEAIPMDGWLKDVAPSGELRKWVHPRSSAVGRAPTPVLRGAGRRPCVLAASG
jgi:uncharacterized protein YeaO (DUF488 family)